MKTKLSDLVAGDEVWQISTHYQRTSKELVTVAKVGRKYISIEQYGRLVPFDKETGAHKDSYRDRIKTDAMIAEDAYVDRLNMIIKSAKLESVGRYCVDWTADEKAQLVALLLRLGKAKDD